MTETLTRTDTVLKSDVIDELEWDPSVNSTHIGVAVTDGAVTLSGESDTYPEKLAAEKAVQRVRGVTAVAQEMTVRSAWGTANDTDIAREAGEAIQRAVNVPDSVKISVHAHLLTLSGTVAWHYQRVAAHRAVQYTRGVDGINNEITIRPSVAPVGIKQSIGAALVRHARLESENIRVAANGDGHVTLSGTVNSWAESRQAEQVAWSAPGVTGITNHLVVSL